MEDTAKNGVLASLREKANQLPLTPGVYIMKDKNGKIIYVGKSKVLKNRVSQYFHENAQHNRKTQLMVANVHSFEVMHTDTEMEALSLENRLIKLHAPKYNIRLKDSKNYPYIQVTLGDPYPRIRVVRKRNADKSAYFGPYSGIGTAYSIARTARKCFGIPSCNHSFPKDIGKIRPCLNHQIGLCPGICRGTVSPETYRESIDDMMLFLKGSITSVEKEMQTKMDYAAENLMFEAAAVYRDRIRALKGLKQKQKIVASPDVELDAFALYSDDVCTVLTVFYVRAGFVSDSESFHFPAVKIVDQDALITFLCDLYEKRTFIPKQILLGFELSAESAETLSVWLQEKTGEKIHLSQPKRGEKKALLDMVLENAIQQAKQYRFEKEKDDQTLFRLSSLLALEVVPERIEAYDISNLGSEHITAGKVVLSGSKFDKSAYRVYKITSTEGPDDYTAMKEAVFRRLSHPEDPYPDLILLDGGKGHVSTIRGLLEEMGIDIPVFGMVKDEYHKTRALVTEHDEISIVSEQSVFLLIYRLQEEVHRFTVSKMSNAKRKTLKTSSLEQIPGIGKAKAKALLSHFGGRSGVANATADELARINGIGKKHAEQIYTYFHNDKENPL